MRKLTILAGLLLILVVANAAVLKKEGILGNGRMVVLELGKRDPRSLMQGDYMRLTYDAASDLRDIEDLPPSGTVIMKDDADGVGRFVRVDDGSALADGEYRIRYTRMRWGYRLGPDAFFFEEGTGARYRRARYGEFRVDENGSVVLRALLDENKERLGD